MAAKSYPRIRAVTLIEVMLATAVFCVAVTGVLSYRYHAARHGRIARDQITATRTGYLLLQDWKANAGLDVYVTGASGAHSPADLDMGFVYAGAGVYKITVDELPMRTELSRSIDTDDRRLIQLTVTVRWPRSGTADEIQDDDPSTVLTTYARIDQRGG